MARLSIRLRLTAWYAAVLLLGLVVFGVGMWLALERHLMTAVDERLGQLAQGMLTVIEVENITSDRRQLQQEISEFAKEVPGGAFQVWDSSRSVAVTPANGMFAAVQFPAPQAQYRTFDNGGRTYRLLTRRMEYGGQTFGAAVALPLDEVRAEMRTFLDWLLAMIPGVLVVACVGGWWISRRALAPVDEITRTAKSITLQNLSRRLAVPQTGDELQRMSETWNEMLERLDASVQRIRQFTADASHELRTPVALIRATAELALRRERQTDEYRKSLREIEGEALRMTQLTESMLTLARADSNGLESAIAPVDLNAVVAEVVEQNLALAETKGIALNSKLVDGPAVIRASEAGIRRLLLILIDNALKHTAAGGTVTVSTTAYPGGGTNLSVRDTGEGIEADVLPHIFERFYRADKSRTNGGVGLGLSIAQAIAQAHQTEIEVSSVEGQGACFSVVFRG